jgi:hypothetical protein
MNPIAITGLVVYELISAVFIYRLWTGKRRKGILLRCFLSLVLLVPVLGWLFYGFMVISPGEHGVESGFDDSTSADSDSSH